MSQKMIACLTAAGISLALLGAVAPAQAQEADALTITRDAESGKLRAMTGAEHAAMQATKAKRAGMRMAAPAAMQKFHASGARGARLTDDMLSSAVVVRQADGSLVKQCFESHGDANAAAPVGHTHATQYVTE
jgi:hypothetical protein